MDYALRPLADWHHAVTERRRHSLFKAPWEDTKRLLQAEAAAVHARLLVLQIDVEERDIRVGDGGLKVGRSPMTPRVAVTIERDEDSLAFYCDRYSAWTDNVRGIALSLTALRAVDRYGVTSAGEQYAGWRAITTGVMTPDEAAAVIASASSCAVTRRSSLAELDNAWRVARHRSHPDRLTGSHEAFVTVEEAGRVLGVGGRE